MTQTSLKKSLFALLAGFVFGYGLMLSGMANPAKVLGFLDITGTWDPSLALVMGGAIAVTLPGFWLLNRFSVADANAGCAPKSKIDRPLVIGAILFGIGWALVGVCPGPALTLIPTAPIEAAKFIVPMLIGLLIGQKLKTKL